MQKHVFLARVFCDMDIEGFCMCLILKKCLNQWHDVGNDRLDLPAVVRGEVFGFKAQLSGVFFHMASPAPAPPNDADTNLMLDMLAKSNLPQEQVAHLRSELEKAKKPKRKDMQDYSMFGLYLPDKLWQKALNPKEDQMSVLDSVVTHLAEKMGLRCPHELTQGTLCGLLVCTMEALQKEKHKEPLALRAFFLTVKSRVATRLGKYRKIAQPEGCDYMTVLPSNRDELPAGYQQLGLEFSEPKVPLSEILSVANDIVYRKNGKSLQVFPVPNDPMQALQGFMAMPWVAGLMASFRQMSQPEIPVHMLPKPKSAVQSLLDRANSGTPAVASAAQPAVPLALEDKRADKPQNLDVLPPSSVPAPEHQVVPVPKPEPVLAPSVPVPSPDGPMSLAASMDRLKAATNHVDSAHDEKKPPPNRKTLKRPASILQKSMKRPAGSSSSQVQLKRPHGKAALKATSSKPKAVAHFVLGSFSLLVHCGCPRGSPISLTRIFSITVRSSNPWKAMKMTDLKSKVLKLVPKKLLKDYRFGCSSCRYVSYCTPSCWAKRGFSL